MNAKHPRDGDCRIREAAKRRAQELRREAIDDFWRGAHAAWTATLGGARRSAQGLAHRLARHIRARREAAASVRQLEG